jgi:transposase
MGRTRTCTTVDDEATRNLTVSLRDALPPNPLARFVADGMAPLDLRSLSGRYGTRGGEPFAPEMLLGVLCSGDATGVCSARRSEQATDASLPCRFLAGDLPPDHDPIAPFRKTCLPALKDLLVQGWFLAHAADGLQLGHSSWDGTTLHADASQSQAVSAKRLLALAPQVCAEGDEWVALSEPADQGPLPDGWSRADDIARRQERLAHVAQAQAGLAARAQEGSQAARAEYEAKRHAREEKAPQQGRTPRGPPPTPPPPGPRDQAQDHGTAPESRLRKNSTTDGFDQHDTAQVATDHDRWLIVAYALSNHAKAQAEGVPPWDPLPKALGTPPAGAWDTGDCSAANLAALAQRGIAPYIAVGRQAPPHHWSVSGAQPPAPPPEDASPLVNMAAPRRTASGQALSRWRTGPVAPGFGRIKAVLGFRPCSRRGWAAAAGAWCLGCLAFTRKRLQVLFAD